jgi:nucleoside-diphosphate-sugar epimerase
MSECPDPRRVLVTGASGFIGSAVVEACQQDGLNVRASGRSESGRVTWPDWVTMDVERPSTLVRALEGMDSVIHCAGLAHQFGRGVDPARFFDVNFKGTKSVVEAAIAASVRHFVLVSSVSVYGASSGELCDESARCDPSGPYAESKYAAEQEALHLTARGKMSLVILRLATAYGEGDPGNVARIMKAIDRGRFVWIGDGSNRKSLIHREDAARACVAAVATAEADREVFNVSDAPCSLRKLVMELALALGRPVPSWSIPGRLVQVPLRAAAAVAGEPGMLSQARDRVDTWLRENVYENRKVATALQFQTRVSLREGIERQVAWYRKMRRR